MAKWPYNTTAWKKLRRAKLNRTPFCEICEMRGRRIPANTVDHILAIAKGGSPFPSFEKLHSMCASCHGAKTAALDRAGGSGIAVKGCDASGRPIDPSHPFNAGGASDHGKRDERGPMGQSRKDLISHWMSPDG